MSRRRPLALVDYDRSWRGRYEARCVEEKERVVDGLLREAQERLP